MAIMLFLDNVTKFKNKVLAFRHLAIYNTRLGVIEVSLHALYWAKRRVE